MKKVKRKVNAVSKSVWATARHLRNDLGPVFGPLRTAKVVISLGKSSKNALLKKQAPKTTSEGLQHAFRSPFDLQEGSKGVPKATPKTLWALKNTVNTNRF